MQLRERGYSILDARLWRRVYWLAPVAALDARDFKQAAWAIGLGERYREQLDTVADMVAASKLGFNAPEDLDLIELVVNILLRFLVRVAHTQMLKARRKASKVVTFADCDEIDQILLDVACHELRQTNRVEADVVRILGRILDAIAEAPDPRIADALAEAFKYVYGEAPIPERLPSSPSLRDIAARRKVPPGTLRSRIHRLLDDIRLPPELRNTPGPSGSPL
jgi:hypothetical protein